MHDKQEELYVFLRRAQSSMEEVILLCQLALKQTDDAVKYSIIRDTIVTYCRPFKFCYGKLGGPYSLDEKFLDQTVTDVHAELMGWRDKIIAHSDIDVLDPKLHCLTTPQGRKTYPITFRGFYAEDMPAASEIKRASIAVGSAIASQIEILEREMSVPKGD